MSKFKIKLLSSSYDSALQTVLHEYEIMVDEPVESRDDRQIFTLTAISFDDLILQLNQTNISSIPRQDGSMID